MPNHYFTLIVDGPDLQDDSTINELYEAGCDDALVGRSEGVQFIDFDRESENLDEAVLSAVADVENLDGLTVLRVADAGLVSMADIAARTARTRESVRLWVAGSRGPGGFPPPVTDPRSRYRLWRWFDVAQWLASSGIRFTSPPEDRLLMAINASLELRQHRSRLDPHRRGSLRTLAGL